MTSPVSRRNQSFPISPKNGNGSIPNFTVVDNRLNPYSKELSNEMRTFVSLTVTAVHADLKKLIAEERNERLDQYIAVEKRILGLV